MVSVATSAGFILTTGLNVGITGDATCDPLSWRELLARALGGVA